MHRNPNIKLTLLLFFLLMVNLGAMAQSSKNFAGQYAENGGILIINEDNTFLIMGYGTLVKGNIEQQDNIIKLIPYKPKQPIVLYGRVGKASHKGNKIMFQNFSDANALINYEDKNASLNSMKRLFNVNANCVGYPNVMEHTANNQQYYFGLSGSEDVYSFPVSNGYNDFIAIYLSDDAIKGSGSITLQFKDGHLYRGDKLLSKSITSRVSEQEIAQMQGMYNRVNAEGEYYYCNPAYNFFEMNGIDITGYQKKVMDQEYYYITDLADEDPEDDYHKTSKIYEYRRIMPVVLKGQHFKLTTGSVFRYTCDSK